MRGAGSVGAALAALALLAGCADFPHNDTLLFGTGTQFGIDVSAAPQTGGIPQVTVGYKRTEFAWMPLLINARSSRVVGCGPTIEAVNAGGSGANPTASTSNQGGCAVPTGLDPRYVGTDGSAGGSSNTATGDIDTYSVLASFGANFQAGGDGGQASTGGGIVQYFATGHAARSLARVGGADLVRIENPDAETVERAQQIAEASIELSALAEAIIDPLQRNREKIISYVLNGGEYNEEAERRFTSLLSGVPEDQMTANRRAFLTPRPTDREDFLRAVRNLTPFELGAITSQIPD